MAWPSPLLQPVTMATLPSSEKCFMVAPLFRFMASAPDSQHTGFQSGCDTQGGNIYHLASPGHAGANFGHCTWPIAAVLFAVKGAHAYTEAASRPGADQ
jgi:hypothetical protein